MWKGYCAAIKCYDCAYVWNNGVAQADKDCGEDFEATKNISTTECGGKCQV